MTKQEIQNHIEKLKNGRAATSDAHQLELIDLGLTKYRKMLAELEKKSDPQPTGKTGQLPDQKPEKPIEKEERLWTKQMMDGEKQENLKPIERTAQQTAYAPLVAPKPTAIIHFSGQPMPGQYTRGELWPDVRQNFKLVLLSATFRHCLKRGDLSELWSMKLYVKLWQGIHEGLKKLEGGKDYTMEELLIRYWGYGEDMKEAGRVLAEFLKQPKPE